MALVSASALKFAKHQCYALFTPADLLATKSDQHVNPTKSLAVMFAHVLLARLQLLPHRTRRPHQSGFTKSRSTLDASLALRFLYELHSQFQKSLHAAFVDLKSAFDPVDRAAVPMACSDREGLSTHVIEVD